MWALHEDGEEWRGGDGGRVQESDARFEAARLGLGLWDTAVPHTSRTLS